MSVADKRPANPRKLFIDDIIEFIQARQAEGSEIIFCLDANEPWTNNNKSIRKLSITCGLIDIHQTKFPDANFASHRSGSTKIDFMLISPSVASSVTRAGILKLDDALCSNHRLLFVDIDAKTFFSGKTSDPVHPQPRSFTKNLKRTTIFRQSIQAEWTRRNFSARVQILSRLSHLPPTTLRRPRLQDMWDKLDNEVGMMIKFAESTLRTPLQPRKWSPALAMAGARKRYWKLRISHVQSGTSYGASLLRRARELRISDDLTTDLTQLQSLHDEATKAYNIARNQDDTLRKDHIDNLINDHLIPNSGKPNQVLKALRALKRSEAQHRMFSKIKSTLKPVLGNSVSRVDIPAAMSPHIESYKHSMDSPITTHNPDLQAILQSTIRTKRKDGAEIWTTVIDQTKLETAILMYSHQHFQQAKSTPFGSGTFAASGLSSASDQILACTLFENHDPNVS
jgi:hypothetical protein